jgi:putative transposase
VSYDSFRHARRSIRLQGFDYRTPRFYFLTICTKWHERLLGEVAQGRSKTSLAGFVAQSVWRDLPHHFPAVVPDEFVVMPNHVHGIIQIENREGAGFPRPESGQTLPSDNGGAGTAPLHGGHEPVLGQIVAYFKYRSTKMFNALIETPANPLWQRNYYERIIRKNGELERIRQYIRSNPQNWDHDPENL